MAKKPPRPGDFEDDFHTISTDDLAVIEESFVIFSASSVVWGEESPQSMGARLSFRDWDWMVQTLGKDR